MIKCKCTDVKDLTFANSFSAAPNMIDFTSVFLKFSPLNQAAVIGTLSAMFVIFVLVIIWAFSKDGKDIYKVTIVFTMIDVKNKIVSVYGPEIRHSHTADEPMVP